MAKPVLSPPAMRRHLILDIPDILNIGSRHGYREADERWFPFP